MLRKKNQWQVGLVLGLGLAWLLAACGTNSSSEAFPTPVSQLNAGQITVPPVGVIKGAKLTFPDDEAPHKNITEWWYYTGHLQTTDEQRYGFELVVFQGIRGTFPIGYASHFAITDLSKNSFKYDQRASVVPPSAVKLGGKTGFKLTVGEWSMQGLAGQEKLTARMQDGSYALDLAITDKKGIAAHGGGLFSYGAVGFSYYYSRPQLAVSGNLVVDGETKTIKDGSAWFDHQWGDFLALAGGWDWYSIQLEDHSELMMYYLRDAKNNLVDLFGSYIPACAAACNLPSEQPVKSIDLVKKDFLLQPLGEWKSPRTGGVYPSGWNLKINTAGVPNLDLNITPLLKDQELDTRLTTGIIYWEGASAVSGTKDQQPIKGNAYVELTGYAKNNPQ